MGSRHALIVRGGWEGHHPVESTELFIPFLETNGYEVRIESSPDVYADDAAMTQTDLIVQSMTMGDISNEALAGLRTAVQSGVGLVGWHGGIADSYRSSSDYLHLIGGQFASHPSRDPAIVSDEDKHTLTYAVGMTALGREHEITAGLEDFELHTEQYWVLHDDLNDVLATTTHPAPSWHPWHREVTSPAVWTRRWGLGRIVVCTPGHTPDILRHPSVRTIIERGMLWATRTASE
ncbi:hypothetical protein ASD56_12240 [Microbacterium sp. Root166]|uniref:ThuA domain-containing protein n=1 Tax=Microbacterium sp. Root166 TaxID=1736478 RepID=UPI0006FB07E2|nr:ThuA domain-containing protein [Microbacterium sp. Root166]KQZ83098.1 hypothetical protein ASD56_12240 [Microbacterium sp. Root166]